MAGSKDSHDDPLAMHPPVENPPVVEATLESLSTGDSLHHSPRVIDGPDIPAAITAWLVRQRWYAGKAQPASLRCLAVVQHVPHSDIDARRNQHHESRFETWFIADDAHTLTDDPVHPQPVVYHVPLSWRSEPLGDRGERSGLISRLTVTDHGTQYVYDAPYDPAYAVTILNLAGVKESSSAATIQRSRVFSGEQSNTSVIITVRDGDGDDSDDQTVLAKIFRIAHAGENPDVTVQAALTAQGSRSAPHLVGAWSGHWPDPIRSGERVTGHLGFVQEFIPDAHDLWQQAVAAAKNEHDFTAVAHAAGRAVARLHLTLTHAFPAQDHPSKAGSASQSLLDRLAWAARRVPEVADRAESIRQIFDAAQRQPETFPRQRIHGDLHLGQILDGGGRGLVLIDFEGEPLRPLGQRSSLDSPLRDVAGMLRSFDYAAGRAAPSRAPAGTLPRGTSWVQVTQDAFCEGYAEEAGRDPRSQPLLLAALQLEKAVYEAVYESTNRPDWLPIPLAAMDHLIMAHQGVTTHSGESPKPAFSPQPLPLNELQALVNGTHSDPHRILGMHPNPGGGLTIRTLRPHAQEVSAIFADGSHQILTHEYSGIFVGVIPGSALIDYRLDVTYRVGAENVTSRVDEPYRFLPTLGEVDLHLIGEGRHEKLWSVLGANLREYDSPMGRVQGVSFAVWAPNARGVRVISDANHWDGTAHPMRSLGSSGVWELFVPNLPVGTRYKFDVIGADGVHRSKADPMAKAAQAPAETASVVTTTGTYTWRDDTWLRDRAETNPHTGPMSIYEVHLGSWRPHLSYQELATELTAYVVELGFTHVEFMPVMAHPYPPSWGYHVTGYYAPDARFGSPDELRHLIDSLHQAGIGVIVDWVPGHFATDPWALSRFDGSPLYEHSDPRRGWHPEWGSYIFDVGRPEVRNFLVANAVYWCEEFHADGLRVDGVASMLYLDYSRQDGEWKPNQFGGRENLDAVQFLQEVNATVYRRIPGVVTIAEESTAWPGVTRPTHVGGLGFGLKWNMGWMHDSLAYMAHEPVHRQWHHHQMTFSLMYAWSENYVLPISHDEVVHGKGSLLGKMPGDRWQQLANVRAYLALMWAHPGKQLLFMGCEFGQEREWADGRGLDWHLLDNPVHRGMRDLVADLNRIYRDHPGLWSRDLDPAGFSWIDANDASGNTLSFVRQGIDPNASVVCVVNFSGGPHHNYRVGLPFAGRWREVLNTDATQYGGSGVGNFGEVHAEDQPHHGRPASALLTVPPLAALWLTPVQE
ncbi:MAG: 1,4-alpha-glucan branching protein GlgB [Actinomycetota bacterium]